MSQAKWYSVVVFGLCTNPGRKVHKGGAEGLADAYVAAGVAVSNGAERATVLECVSRSKARAGEGRALYTRTAKSVA